MCQVVTPRPHPEVCAPLWDVCPFPLGVPFPFWFHMEPEGTTSPKSKFGEGGA